ncbi:MAG: FecR family protein [Spirochaetales bacterium]|nr:FecR family protein [Spirochaetales bacterium]
MIKTTRILLFLILLTLLPASLWAEITAVITEISGDVMVSRKGIILDRTETGTVIGPHDILQTGPDSFAAISIQSPVSQELSIRVLEGTTLYLDHALKKQNPETSLTLHRGGIEADIKALAEGASFNIITNSSVMGVRGTSFAVSTAADTSILVSCREGKVVCTTNDEDSFIQPGKVFEQDPNGQYRLVNVPPADIRSYTDQWKRARQGALREEGSVALENYANLYLQNAPGFLESWSDISSKQSLFRKWETIMEEGKTMSMGEATKDKITLSNGIIRLRTRLPLMEHIFYTLYDLTEILESEEDAAPEISDTAERTLLIYHKRQDEFIEKLTKARYYYRIFLEIDKQSSGHSLTPSSDLMNGFMMDDSFFITPPAPGR